MHPGDLLAIAENLAECCTDNALWRNYGYVAGYVLANVRADDNERVSKAWILERNSDQFMEMRDGIWCSLTDSYIDLKMSKKRFRALCYGLDIELKPEDDDLDD